VPQCVVHDRDALLAHDFDYVLAGARIDVVKTPFRAPDANAYAERWVRSATGECLDHLTLFGLGSLQRALSCYRSFFDGHRPHEGIGNQIPDRQGRGALMLGQAVAAPDRELEVECQQFLGGLLKSYSCKAA
jgi:putative transposase